MSNAYHDEIGLLSTSLIVSHDFAFCILLFFHDPRAARWIYGANPFAALVFSGAAFFTAGVCG